MSKSRTPDTAHPPPRPSDWFYGFDTEHNHQLLFFLRCSDKSPTLPRSQSHLKTCQLIQSQVSICLCWHVTFSVLIIWGKFKKGKNTIHRLWCMVESEKSRGGTVSLLKGIIIFMASIIPRWGEGGVTFHMVKKNPTTSSRKTLFMTLCNYNVNGLLGLSAAGISVFFIDNVPLLKPFGVK